MEERGRPNGARARSHARHSRDVAGIKPCRGTRPGCGKRGTSVRIPGRGDPPLAQKSGACMTRTRRRRYSSMAARSAVGGGEPTGPGPAPTPTLERAKRPKRRGAGSSVPGFLCGSPERDRARGAFPRGLRGRRAGPPFRTHARPAETPREPGFASAIRSTRERRTSEARNGAGTKRGERGEEAGGESLNIHGPHAVGRAFGAAVPGWTIRAAAAVQGREAVVGELLHKA